MSTIIVHPNSPNEAPVVIPHEHSRRCQHRFKNGMRCRLPALPSQSGFCTQHFRESLLLPEPPSDAMDLSENLLPGGLSEFSSADDIRHFLARLVYQVVKGRISPRRATVLAYITNQLLHSQRALQSEVAGQLQQTILDMTSPERDRTETTRTRTQNACDSNATVSLCRNFNTDAGWPPLQACVVPALNNSFTTRTRPGP